RRVSLALVCVGVPGRPPRRAGDLLERRTLLSGSLIKVVPAGLAPYRSVRHYLPAATVLDVAKQDGRRLLDKQDGYEWVARTDDAAQVRRGQTVSAWVEFADAADGRAYFGFGARGTRESGGTLSLVLAANTNQLLLQTNPTFTGHSQLGAVPMTYAANHWYRVEVAWGTGSATGRLYDSDGVTLLGSVTGSDGGVTAGGLAFRGF